jgi:hypothetical protein
VSSEAENTARTVKDRSDRVNRVHGVPTTLPNAAHRENASSIIYAVIMTGSPHR